RECTKPIAKTSGPPLSGLVPPLLMAAVFDRNSGKFKPPEPGLSPFSAYATRSPTTREAGRHSQHADLGYAANWITEWYAYDRGVLAALGVNDNERIAGFVHIGRP